MFSKLALFAAASMAVFVAALPGHESGGIENSCNGGANYCCNSVQSANSVASKKAFSVLSIIAPIAGDVGFTCSPITAAGIAGNSCTSQKACCSGDSYNGAIVLGCSPTNVNV